MPSYVIRNEQYRDEILNCAYPFSEASRLENDEVYIGTDVVVDAVLYFKEAVELPVHISAFDGTYGTSGQARMQLSDLNGNLIAYCVVDETEELGEVHSYKGLRCGTIVFDLDGVKRFIGRIGNAIVAMLPDVAELSLEVSHVAPSSGWYCVTSGGTSLYGDVSLVAGHGMQFTNTANGVQLNVVGDRVSFSGGAEGSGPIRSINGVENASIWLAAHPLLNIRIDNTEAGVRFVHVQDDTR